MQILEHNIETGETIERDATADEIAQMQIDAEKQAIADQAESDKETAKAALLERLGITAEEAALLIK